MHLGTHVVYVLLLAELDAASDHLLVRMACRFPLETMGPFPAAIPPMAACARVPKACASRPSSRSHLAPTRAGCLSHPQLRPALDLVIAKCRPDGRSQSEFVSPLAQELGVAREGTPSKWITLRALRVLNWWES